MLAPIAGAGCQRGVRGSVHAARLGRAAGLPPTIAAMVVSDRVLMGPGPCNPYPEAVAASARPMLGHLDPEFIGVLDETCDRLRRVWATSNALTLPVSGTGSAGMEAAFVNVLSPGDVIVVAVNGLFGERMCDVAAQVPRRSGASGFAVG